MKTGTKASWLRHWRRSHGRR